MRRPPAQAPSGGLGRWILSLAVIGVVVGCGPRTPSLPATQPASPTSAVIGTPAPPSTAAPSPSSATPASPAVTEDASLLAILPAAVDDAPVRAEAQSFTDALADPSFVANVQAAVFAVAVSGSDLASGIVAHLRPGVYSDAFFRDWRDTYDTGACAQAGGVVGNAEAELGGRTVYVTSCAGGLRVYHAHLPGRDVVVSLFSVGDRRFGEQLMAGLRP